MKKEEWTEYQALTGKYFKPVVQLDPEKTENKMFSGCFMIVTETKTWGIQGYVQSLGENGNMGGQAYYRAKWETFELSGKAIWDVDIDGED